MAAIGFRLPRFWSRQGTRPGGTQTGSLLLADRLTVTSSDSFFNDSEANVTRAFTGGRPTFGRTSTVLLTHMEYSREIQWRTWRN